MPVKTVFFSFTVSILIHSSIFALVFTEKEKEVSSDKKQESSKIRQINNNLSLLNKLFHEDDAQIQVVPWWSQESRNLLIDYYIKKKRDIKSRKSKNKMKGKVKFVSIGETNVSEVSYMDSISNKSSGEKKCKDSFVGIGVQFLGNESKIEGSEIETVAKGKPADRLGIRPGDFLIGIEHKGYFYRLSDYVFKEGDYITLLLRRGKSFFEVSTKLEVICYSEIFK